MKTLSLTMMVLSLGLSACSLLGERSESSGYADANPGPSSAQEFYRERSFKNYNKAREELGLPDSRELTESEVQNVRTRAELARLERALTNSQEKKQYYGLKPYFRNDGERIYFLRLPTREARERWANNQGLTANETSFDSGVAQLIEKNDIARGMSRAAVEQSWGEADFIETAGDPLYGNERWRYTKQVSTDEGYKSETRIIFFESGRVVGWETL